MGEVLQFKRRVGKQPSKGLCQHGFHKWKIDKSSRFDSTQGKLRTILVCERCGKMKTELR
ncbi:MAG: hypothetical protein CME36_20780 [unclassified Hahellaceae]|nr:hypothetical protein [Hahellaceae bacterium]